MASCTALMAQTPASGPPVVVPQDVWDHAVAQVAPSWQSYEYTKRKKVFNASYAFNTLAMAAYAGTGTQKTAATALVVDRLRTTISGGKEPECLGGLGGWTHGPFAWGVAYVRKTPAAWSQFTTAEKQRIDLLMRAFAVAVNFTLDDDNDYKTLLDGDRNYGRNFNPNHIEGYIGVGLATSWYFGVGTPGADALDAFFVNFDFDAFIAELTAANFTNIKTAWLRTPMTKQALMHGGMFNPSDMAWGYGVGGVAGNIFTYAGYRLSSPWAIYKTRATQMFKHTVQTRLPITNVPNGYTQLDDPDPYRLSPREGQMGMLFEFKTTNAPQGPYNSGFRSDLPYSYVGWALTMSNVVGLYLSGKVPDNADNDQLFAKTIVGTEDLIFKANEGYKGFANGDYETKSKADFSNADPLGMGGWIQAKFWWSYVILAQQNVEN